VIRAALDANILISGTIVTAGISSRLVDAARARQFVLVTSRPIIDEVIRNLSRDRIRRRYDITLDEIARVRVLLEDEAALTTLTVPVHGVATHPEDDLILATALSGQADYLVTGDRQLLNLGRYQGVRILSPRAFWEVLSSEEAGGARA
jgi:putative PIN family toxin of toxin-antitoxin system